VTNALPLSACRPHCAACCIAPSISSPIPGMPQGKPAGVACVQLDEDLRCRLFGLPQRPQVCVRLRPEPDMCGASRQAAMATLTGWETLTLPTIL
jgi:uncharacterized protein